VSQRSRARLDARQKQAPSSEAERERRRVEHRRRERQARLQMGFYAFCLVALIAGYWYAEDLSVGARIPFGAEIRAPDGTAFLAADAGREEEPIQGLELRKNDRQRRLVDELARRHVGTEPRGDLHDLEILQEIVDARVLGPEQTFELQALGVVLGDVMERQLGLEWIVVDDRYGRSRALGLGEGGGYLFPVTMISRRYEAGLVVDVEQIYRDAAAEVAASRAR